MNGAADTLVRDVAPGGQFRAPMGIGAGARKAARVAESCVARRVEPDSSARVENASCEQFTTIPVAELKHLYATIADLRKRIDVASSMVLLGPADHVILQAMRAPMTRRQIAERTRISSQHVARRLHLLKVSGHIHADGKVSRKGCGMGCGETLWVKTPNAHIDLETTR